MDLQEFVQDGNNGNLILDCIWLYSDSITQVESLLDIQNNELTQECVNVITEVRDRIALHLKNAGESEITSVIKTLRRHLLMPKALQYIADNQRMLKRHYARFVNKQEREDCYGDTVYTAVADCMARYDPSRGPFETYLKRWLGWIIKKWRDKREPEKYRCQNFTTLFADSLPKHEENVYEFQVDGNQEKLIDGEDILYRVKEYNQYVAPEYRLILKLYYVDGMTYTELATMFKKSFSFIGQWLRDAKEQARMWFQDDLDPVP